VTLGAVVFDFDGLIIDSEWAIYETAKLAFAVHGHDLSVEAWATIVGLGDDDDELAWSTLLLAMGIDDFEMATYSATYAAQDRPNRDSLPLLPGVEVLVDSLTAARVPIGVASSSSVAWLERHLDRLGLLHRFGTLVGADVVGGVGKPAPDVYLRACADLGAHPRTSVALEDSGHGVTAAKAAGMVAVAVPSRITRHNDLTHADLVVDTLEDLSLSDLAALVP
jgi:HAD superfamily hydrolase (TIGR01509 family)